MKYQIISTPLGIRAIPTLSFNENTTIDEYLEKEANITEYELENPKGKEIGCLLLKHNIGSIVEGEIINGKLKIK